MSQPYTIAHEFATDVVTFLKSGKNLEEIHSSMVMRGWTAEGLEVDISQCLDTDTDALAHEKDQLKLWLEDDPSHKDYLDEELSSRPLEDVSTFLMNESVHGDPVMVSEGLLQQYRRKDPAFWTTAVEDLEEKLTQDPKSCSQFVDRIIKNHVYATTDTELFFAKGTTKKAVERNPAYRSVFLKAHPYTAAGKALATLQTFEDGLYAGRTYEEVEKLYKPKQPAALFRSLHPETQNYYFDSFLTGDSVQRRLQWNAVRQKLQTPAKVPPQIYLPDYFHEQYRSYTMDQSIQTRKERAINAETEDEAENASVFSPEQKAAFRSETAVQVNEAGLSNVDYQTFGYQQDWQSDRAGDYDQGNGDYQTSGYQQDWQSYQAEDYDQGSYEDDGSGGQGYQDW